MSHTELVEELENIVRDELPECRAARVTELMMTLLACSAASAEERNHIASLFDTIFTRE